MTTKQLYRHFKENHPFPVCWACGRDESERPDGWFGPFVIERCHIVSKPRHEDVRLIVLLDTICHRVSSGERLFLNGELWPLPPLTVANLLALKKFMDPENFDRAFLQRYSVQRLPRAIKPPLVYRTAFHSRRGMVGVT